MFALIFPFSLCFAFGVEQKKKEATTKQQQTHKYTLHLYSVKTKQKNNKEKKIICKQMDGIDGTVL